jgi:hypothetical protein
VAGSVRIDKIGKPVVFVVTDNFVHDAKSAAEDTGMPRVRMVTVPADEYYKQRVSREEVKPIAVAAVNALIDGLIRPLTEEEAGTNAKQAEIERTIKVTAESYDAALEKFNQLFLDNHWGSGLPLVPPTPERVKWMLTGTKRSPQEVIGTVAPKNGKATIEKIAINAVMAGARPEYLPVIIAAMEALTDRSYDLLHVMSSTGSFTLQIVVNGPIAEEIGMNSGIGLLGYGFRANNTIGHALRLSLINLGHLWPGENDMALIGRPSSHTFYVFSENERSNPWEPYHVSLGYKKEDSCVTVSTVGSYSASLSGLVAFGGGAVFPWTPQSLLDSMVRTIKMGRDMMTVWKFGTAVPSPGKQFLVLHPEFAMELNRKGFTRKKLQEYLYEESRIPYEQLSPKEIASVRRRLADREIPEDRAAVFEESLKSGGKVPLLIRPEHCYVFVAGGIPGYSFGTSYFSTPPYGATAVLTKPIRDAALTKAGR